MTIFWTSAFIHCLVFLVLSVFVFCDTEPSRRGKRVSILPVYIFFYYFHHVNHVLMFLFAIKSNTLTVKEQILFGKFNIFPAFLVPKWLR